MITSGDNMRLKLIGALLNKSKTRKEEDAFVTEGIKMVLETPKEDMIGCFVSEEQKPEVISKAKALYGDKTEVVKKGLLEKLSDTKTPQGIMAIVKRRHYSLDDMLKKENPFIVLLDGVRDPGNMGTIIRTAEGAGATGIIMSKDCVDIYNPKTVRSTMGALFRVAFAYNEDTVSVIDTLQKAGIKVVATHLSGENNYFEEDMTVPCAIVIGNESTGITEECAQKADKLVRIPMEGKLESLNAAVAAAVIMYDVKRQRS